MKKLLLFYLTLASLFVVSSCSSEDIITQDEPVQTSIGSDKNAKAREAGNRLLDSFGMTRSHTLDYNAYPDYYGGGYINKDGKLVVFVEGDLINGKEILTRSAGSDDVIYVRGEYSYKDLRTMYDNIYTFKCNNRGSQVADNIKCYYLNDFENNLVVELKDYSELAIKEFKKYITESSAIVFKKFTRKFTPHSLSPGSPLEYSSVGYRARRYGTEGVVTAGHAYSTNETVRSVNGETIGYCDYSVKSGSVDAAFLIITNYNYTPNNGRLTREESRIWAGDSVTKLGKTVSESEGYIQNTSISVDADGVTLHDIAEATYLSARGDSGGAVYLTGTGSLVGIHQGSTNFNALFCKVSNISNELGISFY